MRKTILSLIVLLLTISTGSATSSISVSPTEVLEIPVGSTGEFTITLDTDLAAGPIEFETDDPYLFARLVDISDSNINSGGYATSGNIEITGITGPKIYILYVQPQDGITIGEQIDTTIYFRTTSNKLKAMATATSNPVPELATIALVSAGLIGLFGLVRRRRSE